MKTIVLDDDPTGTQCSRDVTVLLRWTPRTIAAVLDSEDAVYLQTNSRSLGEDAAVQLAASIRAEVRAVERILDEPVAVVLRGDSTLRGHVFAESDVFVAGVAPVLFVPAYPSAGRRTVNSMHTVDVSGTRVPVSDTEFAADPVFGFATSDLTRFVRDRGARTSIAISLELLRQSRGRAVAEVLAAAGPGVFVIPDVETNDDLRLVADAATQVHSRSMPLVIRCAAPLAAMIAGCFADRLMGERVPAAKGPVLVVCGSHTDASTRQLDTLTRELGWTPRYVDTDAALRDRSHAAAVPSGLVADDLEHAGIAVVASERVRRPDDNTLVHGESVMEALVGVTTAVAPRVRTVITKGGITGAEVIRRGFRSPSARVLGQVIVGVSLWRLNDGRETLAAVVPGNIGEPDALLQVAAKLGLASVSGNLARKDQSGMMAYQHTDSDIS